MQKPDEYSDHSITSMPMKDLDHLENYQFLGTRCVDNSLVYLGITEFENCLAKICELKGPKGATHYYVVPRFGDESREPGAMTLRNQTFIDFWKKKNTSN